MTINGFRLGAPDIAYMGGHRGTRRHSDGVVEGDVTA
jgi:hypothetical protein